MQKPDCRLGSGLFHAGMPRRRDSCGSISREVQRSPDRSSDQIQISDEDTDIVQPQAVTSTVSLSHSTYGGQISTLVSGSLPTCRVATPKRKAFLSGARLFLALTNSRILSFSESSTTT